MQLTQLNIEVRYNMDVGAMTGPQGEKRLRGVGGDDEDVGHVGGVVKGGQKSVSLDEFRVFVRDNFGNWLDTAGLLRCKCADGDVGVLRTASESRIMVKNVNWGTMNARGMCVGFVDQ